MKMGRESYADPIKQTWRGWQWNQICRRLPEWDSREMPSIQSAEFRNVAKTKTVLYLAGEEALDIESATSKGFCRDNMIGIDIREKAVKSVRGMGAIAIQGTLNETLLTWPDDWKIDVVVADFCSGLSQESMDLFWAMFMCHGLYIGSVVSVNLQRGRDRESNSLRGMNPAALRVFEEMYGFPGGSGLKHRGCQWFMAAQIHDYQGMVKAGISEHEAWETIKEIGEFSRPVISEYHRPGSPVFDSLVLKWFHDITATHKKRSLDDLEISDAMRIRLESQSRKVTAARAVRSSRIN